MYTKSVYVGRGNGGEGIIRSDSQFYNLVADKKEKISKNGLLESICYYLYLNNQIIGES